MITDVNDSEITIEKKPTIGQRLSHARQEKKLTLGEVATELRLTKKTIELIENEQWTELHGRAYARGYFSNYVKLLGLPEDEFLAAFNVEYTVAEPTLLTARHRVEIQNKNSSWLPSLLFITVLVIVWFAYQQMQVTSELVIEETVPVLQLAQADDSDALIEDVSKEEYEASPPALQPQANELAQPVIADTEFLINSEQANNVSSDVSEVVMTKEMDTIELQSLGQASNTSDDLLPEATAVVAAQATLDLRFSDDCWVEVKDANNKALLRKLMTRDDSIILTGRAPLTVMLGRASASQVRFNDELFDPSAFTQKDVARFTLGAES